MNIKINESLRLAAEKNPTKESRQMNISDLCKKIEDNTLTLPLYQRDVSWTKKQAIDLLNYQLLGKSPISAISINVINDKSIAVPQVSFITRELVNDYQNNQLSVVDGQQRLTTNYKAYSNDKDFKDIFLDLGKGKFVQVDGVEKANQIPVGILLNKDDSVLFDYAEQKKGLTAKVINTLISVKQKIKNYNYTINSATDLTEDEQIKWFEVLNNAGSRVSVIQMKFANLKTQGIDIYRDYTNIYKEKLEKAGYDLFKPQKTSVSYPIAALNPAYEIITKQGHNGNFAPIPSDTKEDRLCKLKPEELKECFKMTLEALDQTINFINDELSFKPDRIDYINYLLGYITYVGHLDQSDKKYLKNWCQKVDFTNQSNTTRRKIFTDLIYKSNSTSTN